MYIFDDFRYFFKNNCLENKFFKRFFLFLYKQIKENNLKKLKQRKMRYNILIKKIEWR